MRKCHALRRAELASVAPAAWHWSQQGSANCSACSAAMAARQSGKDRRDKLAHGDAEITDERDDNDRGALGSSHVVPFR